MQRMAKRIMKLKRRETENYPSLSTEKKTAKSLI